MPGSVVHGHVRVAVEKVLVWVELLVLTPASDTRNERTLTEPPIRDTIIAGWVGLLLP